MCLCSSAERGPESSGVVIEKSENISGSEQTREEPTLELGRAKVPHSMSQLPDWQDASHQPRTLTFPVAINVAIASNTASESSATKAVSTSMRRNRNSCRCAVTVFSRRQSASRFEFDSNRLQQAKKRTAATCLQCPICGSSPAVCSPPFARRDAS
jgi:hypothetical protein